MKRVFLKVALKAHCDWLLELWISFAIYLYTTGAGQAFENIVIITGINDTTNK